MDKNQLPVHRLDLRVRELRQLFNSMDPAPFLNKDLDREAEAYIENWALGIASNSRLQLTIHVEQFPAEADPGQMVALAVHNYFEYKVERVRSELRQLLRLGRASLLIGVAFVTVCLLAADLMKQAGGGTTLTIAREGLTIVGWVAMWKPVQIFLYDWWPLRRRIHVYKNLQYARVEVMPANVPLSGSDLNSEIFRN
jgi:hypothetical protein